MTARYMFRFPRSMAYLRLATLALLLVLVGLVIRVGTTPIAEAATFNIPDGDVAGLIAAINSANGNGQADVINLAAGGTYTLMVIDNVTEGNNGLPSFTSEITINGNGATILRSNTAGTPDFRFFHVAGGGTLRLDHLTVRNGAATGGTVLAPEGRGGALFNRGIVELTNVSVMDNLVSNDGGGIFNNAGGTLTVTDSAVDDNSAGESGGGIDSRGDTTVIGSSISDNSAATLIARPGGGLFNGEGGTMSITDSTISGNSATNAGGIANGNGTITLNDSTVNDNTATDSGGGIVNASGVAATATMTISDSTINGNTAVFGGGIRNFDDLTLSNSTVSDNSVSGGVFNEGGGINNRQGTMTIDSSTISGNTSTQLGGGIFNDDGAMKVTNSTVSGNSVQGAGGGIFNDLGPIDIVNSTISGNSADGAGGIFNNEGTTTLKNSIIADNPSFGDCDGALFVSLGHNLDSDGTCNLTAASDLPNTISLLGLLQNNGGPTETHALLLGSPAIDVIPVAGCTDVDGNSITTDQRGVPRPQGLDCDIGAFELEQAVVDTTPPTCELTGFNDHIVEITVQDNDSGLAAINVVGEAHSVDLEPIVFHVGTTDPVVITAIRRNPAWDPFIHLEIIDLAGNVTECVLDGRHLLATPTT
ncbi:MAG: hypothetical protein IH861_03680 [Chloroflexi bacterium]|nr:hypothetical protein [Chloroflexota bacterium]